MEIRRVLRGENTAFAPARPAQNGEKGQKVSGAGRPTADRLELSRQWVESMEEQRVQTQAALLAGEKEKKSNGILDMLDGVSAEQEELDALSQEMKAKMKCLEIAMRMMKGKKVPPEDERYLMENDPEGYKVAMAMKAFVKEDKEECESVLKDEEKNSGQTAEAGEAAPVEEGGEPSGGGDASVSDGGGETE